MSTPLSFAGKALALASAVVALCALQPAFAANIVETAKADGHFTKLLEANQAAGTAALLTQPGPFTVFAPNDDAFAKVPPDKLQALMTPAMKTMLKVTLGNHIVTGVLDMSAIEAALDARHDGLDDRRRLAGARTSQHEQRPGLVVHDPLLIGVEHRRRDDARCSPYQGVRRRARAARARG